MKKSWIAGILGVLVLCVSMVACIEDDEKSAVKAAYGGSSQSSAMAHAASATSTAAVSSANEVKYESDNGEIAFDYDAGSDWDTPMPDDGAMREEVASRGYNQKGSSEADQRVDLKSEMLVYRCSIWMDTMEFEKTVAALKQKISEYHGFVENEQQSDGATETSRYRLKEEDKNYSYFATIRIPSAYYESFVSATEGLGILRSKNSSVDNVATQYGTLKNQLQIAQTEYDRYLQQYENTQDEKVALKIQSELYNLAVTISDLKTRMSMMENDVAYSYVTIRIHKVTEKELEPEEKEEEKEEPEEDTFATRMSKTADESWKKLLGFLESVLVFLIMNWWIIVLAAILLIIVIFLIRFLTRRAARIRAKKRAEEEARIEERRKQREAEEDHFGNHYQAAKMQGSRGAAASAKESRNEKEKPSQKKEESSDSESEETEKK